MYLIHFSVTIVFTIMYIYVVEAQALGGNSVPEFPDGVIPEELAEPNEDTTDATTLIYHTDEGMITTGNATGNGTVNTTGNDTVNATGNGTVNATGKDTGTATGILVLQARA